MCRQMAALADVLSDDAEQIGRVLSPQAFVGLSLLTSLLMRRRLGAERVAVATIFAALLAKTLKHLVGRRRPRWFGKEQGQSFPSGHGATSTAYLLAMALNAPRRHRRLALGMAVAGIATMDVTRLVAREHWTSDVLAGDGLGAVSVAAAVLLHHRYRLPMGTGPSRRRVPAMGPV